MGHNLDLAGSAQKAAACLDHLVALRPDDAAVQHQYGSFLAGIPGTLNAALPHLEKALALGDESAARDLGLLQVMLGQPDKAKAILRKHLEAQPDDADARQVLDALEQKKVVTRTVDDEPDPKAFHTADELGTFMTDYHQHPEPDRVDAAIRFLGKNGLDAEHTLATSGFFAIVLARHPDHARGWLALARKQPGNIGKALKTAAMISTDPYRWAAARNDAPELNDFCWAAFFASGDARYVERILAALAHLDERTDMKLYLAAATAQWSLASNARQHDAVRTIVEKAHALAKAPLDQALEQVLTVDPEEFRAAVVRVLKEQHEKGVW